MDHLFAVGVFIEYFSKCNLANRVVVSPDVGGIKMARAYAKRLNAELAIIDKRRISPEKAEAVHILGEVKGMNAIIVDDLIATGGSLIEAVEALKKEGAGEVRAAISHGVLSNQAVELINNCRNLKELVITDSIPLPKEKAIKKIKVLSIASLFGEAIKRIHHEESVSSLFD
jgi:ribose-phosphate pyrophosphokinase